VGRLLNIYGIMIERTVGENWQEDLGNLEIAWFKKVGLVAYRRL